MTDGERRYPGAWAAATPDHPAVVMGGSGEVMSYAEFHETACRLANLFGSLGLEPGDHVALCLENRVEYLALTWGARYAGLYYTAISSRLTAEELGYIVEDSGSRVLITSPAKADQVAELMDQLGGLDLLASVGGPVDGCEPLEDLLAAQSPKEPLDAVEGLAMLYSSGTTGRPKGIVPPAIGGRLGAPAPFTTLLTGLFGFTRETVYLSPAPLYHAAPAGWTTMTQRLGGTAVVMERFDPIEFLAQIERHRVTHTQVVPTHLVRLLKLPGRDRTHFDLSSLQLLVHAAAPCPVEVKQAALEWLGPVIHEFYSGSEGSGFCYIGPDDWVAHPGSVGRSLMGGVHILDDDGEELPAGETGHVWFETPHRFEYHRDPEKTASAWNDRGWSTLGDIGWVDDGYLYLTDRASNMIISGGVNIYPREIEDLLVMHPGVADVAVLGTPDPDRGEQVTAFVQPMPGIEASDALADELIGFCRERLSHFKCPRTVRFVDELPRLPTGKLLKRMLV
jgi:long-chain acyl-CoA synthetase